VEESLIPLQSNAQILVETLPSDPLLLWLGSLLRKDFREPLHRQRHQSVGLLDCLAVHIHETCLNGITANTEFAVGSFCGYFL